MGWLEKPYTAVYVPGIRLWMIPYGENLRRGRKCLPKQVYNALLRLLLLLICLFACTTPGVLFPSLSQTMTQNLLCLFLCQIPAIAMHELAHVAAANDRGIPVNAFGIGINLGMPCLCTLIQLIPFTPLQTQRAVYKAGPLSNLCIGCICLTLCLRVRRFCNEILFWAAVANLLLAAINLLPFVVREGMQDLAYPPRTETCYDLQPYVL